MTPTLVAMSHEIHTPMNAIPGYAELLSQENLMSQQSQCADITMDNSSQLVAVISDIMDITKHQKGNTNGSIAIHTAHG